MKISAKQGQLSARTIWGKVVLYLREHKEVALHVACGDITDVAIEGDNFIINVIDGMLINLFQEGRREIERALSWQGFDLKLIINCKKEVLPAVEQDIKRLKEVFDDVQITYSNLIWR